MAVHTFYRHGAHTYLYTVLCDIAGEVVVVLCPVFELNARKVLTYVRVCVHAVVRTGMCACGKQAPT